ncbi:MFS transporter [Desulfurispira natronophila]|uniref:Lysosomal dipeptide transporter MFSD1 n=1 Tax=Desulfurispira natronophila TaxID=682562 RepID=A0A7W7Y4H6_9BACT|nr:MFS transporter [Desulfurispira natronophila]MBB5021936.1 MFS family permease [Desulfurispira natronophila]
MSFFRRAPLAAVLPRPWLKWAGWSLLVTIFMTGFFFRFAPATLSAGIQLDLRLSATALGLVASMHFWVYTAMQVPAGLLVDRLGLRRAGLLGGAITALGAWIFGTADGLAALMWGTGLMGMGLSAVFVALMKYNTLWFRPERHSVAMGATMLLAALGSMLAESPTALLLHWLDWNQIVLVLAALTTVVTLGLLLACQESPLILPDQPPAPRRPGLLRSSQMVLGQRQLWLLFACVGATNGSLYAFLGLWAVPLMSDALGTTHTHAALYPTLALFIYAIGLLFCGWYSDYLQRRRPIILVIGAISVAVWGMLALAPWQPGVGAFLLFGLLGFSGSHVAVIFSLAKESVGAINVGFAIALVNMGAFLVAAIVQVAFGGMLDLAQGWNLTEREAYQVALLLPLALSLLGFLAALGVRETGKG